MSIRQAEIKDIDEIMQIWKTENIKAHYFISSDYWEQNYCSVKNALPQAEIYVSVYKNEISGFIGLSENYIEGIFVKSNQRHNGIGSALLNNVKGLKSVLTLNVYKKNVKAVNFYLKNGFIIINEGIDANTNESEYTMQWVKSKI